MNLRSSLSVAVAASFVSLLAYGGVESDRALEHFHIQDFLGDMQPELQQAIKRRKAEGTVPDSELQTVEDLGMRIYPAKNLFVVVKQRYAKAMKPEALKELRRWQVTPDGVRVRQAYEAAFKATAGARQGYFDKESAAMLRPNRKNAFNSFIRAWEQDKAFAAVAAGFDYGVMAGLSAFAPPASREPLSFLQTKSAGRRSGYQGSGREYFTVFDFYLLKDFKNEEVDDLTKFATSAVGQAHTKALLKALETAFNAAGATLFEQVGRSTFK